MICALLVFQTPDLPVPLLELSPWLDWLITPREQVYARLHQLTGQPGPGEAAAPRPSLREWLLKRIGAAPDPRDELARYHARAAQLAAPDLLDWLHREGSR